MPENIHTRIYRFVINALKSLSSVAPNAINTPILAQLIRSVTSVGANDREADGALTKKDFISKYVIVRKELKESVYWIELLKDLNSNLSEKFNVNISEGYELTKIISTIIIKTRANIK